MAGPARRPLSSDSYATELPSKGTACGEMDGSCGQRESGGWITPPINLTKTLAEPNLYTALLSTPTTHITHLTKAPTYSACRFVNPSMQAHILQAGHQSAGGG